MIPQPNLACATSRIFPSASCAIRMDLDRMVGQSAAIQDAVARAKTAIAELLAVSRDTRE